MAELQGRYRIGELARLTGLTPRTLRYYEELELISSQRSSGGHRIYGEGCRRRLLIIESLKAAGFTLREIRHLLLDWKQSSVGREAAEKVLAILRAKEQEVERTIGVLSTLKEQLRVSIDMLENCTSCPQKPEPSLCSSCDASQDAAGENPLVDEIRGREGR